MLLRCSKAFKGCPEWSHHDDAERRQSLRPDSLIVVSYPVWFPRNFLTFACTMQENRNRAFLGSVLINDMQTTPHPLLKTGQIGFLFQKVAQCSETYEEIIFRFLVFQIWSILYSKFLESWQKNYQKCQHFFVSEDEQCSETNPKSIFRFYILLFLRCCWFKQKKHLSKQLLIINFFSFF